MPLKLKSKESNEKVVTIQITWGATQIFFFACEAHAMVFLWQLWKIVFSS